MGEIIQTLFNSYGLVTLAVVVSLAILIWIVSHFATKPGGKVSILWGLTSYDRSDSVKPNTTTSSSQNFTLSENKTLPEISHSPQVLLARIDDSLLVDTETQRAGSSLAVFNNGTLLNQLAIVTLTMELQGKHEEASIELHLKRKRPGNIISAMPQGLGDVSYQNTMSVTSLGLKILLRKMKPGEQFRIQIITDGLRTTDFHLVQEPRKGTLELNIVKSQDWQP